MSSKKTTIGSCPAHWDVVKFSKVAELQHGYQFRTTDFTEQGIKILKITQIKDNGCIDISSCSYIDSKRLKTFESNIVKKGDILMALSGATIGKIGRYNSDEIVLQNYRVGNFVPHDERVLNKDYFYHFLSTEKVYFQILANQNQSAQENVGKEDIHNILVFLPPLPEQTAIASVLNSLDNKIDLLHRQNATLEKMAETLFRKWFVEEAKEEWEVVKLGNFIHPKKGKNITKSEAIEGEFPVVAGGLEPSCFHHQSNTKAPVVTISASGANAGFVRLYNNPVWSSDSSFIDETITPYVYFFYVFLKMNQDLLFDKQEGSAQPHIYPSHIMELEISNMPESAIKRFETEVKPMFEKIKSNQTQIRTLTALRDTLLPKLMSGEVRLNTM